MWYELSRWWAYRQIQHPRMHVYLWLLPGILAVFLTVIFFLLPVRPDVSGSNGILAAIIQTVSMLPGFFITSLAAVATFQRPEMDVEMPAPTPSVEMRLDGVKSQVLLTRRMFLSYLFSYLAIISLMLVVLCASANLIAPSAVVLVNAAAPVAHQQIITDVLLAPFLGFLLFWCASMLITTFHGIYFLTERMHQPN
jgi:hypothetical protein